MVFGLWSYWSQLPLSGYELKCEKGAATVLQCSLIVLKTQTHHFHVGHYIHTISLLNDLLMTNTYNTASTTVPLFCVTKTSLVGTLLDWTQLLLPEFICCVLQPSFPEPLNFLSIKQSRDTLRRTAILKGKPAWNVLLNWHLKHLYHGLWRVPVGKQAVVHQEHHKPYFLLWSPITEAL